MPDGLPDALLIERFDIRRDLNDHRRIALEDMASVRGVAPAEKYHGSIEQVARALRGVSSDPEADITILLGRATFAWLIADGDFHLKNMAVLGIAGRARRNFSSVRFAPAYDTATTRIFPGFENDDVALSLAGKRNRLSLPDFVRAGVTMGLSATATRGAVDTVYGRLNAHIQGLDPAPDKVSRAITTWKRRIDTIAN